MRQAWEKWKKIAERVGDFQATVLFSILYFLLVTGTGRVASLFRDFLATRSSPRWHEKGGNAATLEELSKQ